jgi:hypothetical protein
LSTQQHGELVSAWGSLSMHLSCVLHCSSCLFSRGLLSAYGSYEKYYETTLLSSTPSTTIAWVGTLQGVILICKLQHLPEGKKKKTHYQVEMKKIRATNLWGNLICSGRRRNWPHLRSWIHQRTLSYRHNDYGIGRHDVELSPQVLSGPPGTGSLRRCRKCNTIRAEYQPCCV